MDLNPCFGSTAHTVNPAYTSWGGLRLHVSANRSRNQDRASDWITGIACRAERRSGSEADLVQPDGIRPGGVAAVLSVNPRQRMRSVRNEPHLLLPCRLAADQELIPAVELEAQPVISGLRRSPPPEAQQSRTRDGRSYRRSLIVRNRSALSRRTAGVPHAGLREPSRGATRRPWQRRTLECSSE